GGSPAHFSPNSKQLVAGNHLWDVASGRRLSDRTLPGTFSAPDGKAVFVRNGSVISRWDGRAGREQRRLDGHCMALSPDCHRVVTGWRSTLIVWDARTGKQLRTIKLKEGEGVTSTVAYSPDGKRIAGCFPSEKKGGSEGSVLIWDAESGRK